MQAHTLATGVPLPLACLRVSKCRLSLPAELTEEEHAVAVVSHLSSS